jgi:hypothetical protein
VAIGSGDAVRVPLTVPVGRLSLSATGIGPDPLSNNLLSYTIKRLDDPQQDPIVTSRPAPVLFLPAGRYRIEGRYGLTNVETVREVEIKAGQTLQLALEHQIGALKLRFAGADEVAWEVQDEDGRTVWTGRDAETAATLQAGRYLVTAQTPSKHEELAVELRPGEIRPVELRGD